MVKGLERGIELGPIVLLEKSGGKEGRWKRPGYARPEAERQHRRAGRDAPRR
jgi:hypothetical protein